MTEIRPAPPTASPSLFSRQCPGGRLLRLLFSGFVLFAMAACDPLRRDTLENLHAIGPDTLRREAATFYKDLFVAPGSTYFNLGNEKCPPSFQRLRPLRVRGYPDGFALTFLEETGHEQGVYIVPLHMEAPPQTSSTATFERLEEGLYWFHFRN